MPRTPIDYSKTLIYKLVHKDDLENSNIYVGSTTDFRRRKNNHKTNCNNPKASEYNFKVYQNIRENHGWDEWFMLEIEKFPCIDKREADARERYWCEFYKSKLNMLVPGRSSKEYREEHKEEKNEYVKKYYIGHKEERKIYNTQYREKHSENIKEYNKEYAKANKEHRNTQSREKVTCECGKSMNRSSLQKHKKNICKSLQVT